MKTFSETMRDDMNKSKRLLSPLIKVRHVKGSGDQKSPFGGTWKEYWLEMSRRNGTYKSFPDKKTPCPCCGRLTEPEDFVGGHVESVDDPNKKYICPVRNSCNSKYGIGKEDSHEFEVNLWDCEEIK